MMIKSRRSPHLVSSVICTRVTSGVQVVMFALLLLHKLISNAHQEIDAASRVRSCSDWETRVVYITNNLNDSDQQFEEQRQSMLHEPK